MGGDLLGVMERSPEILDEPGVQFYLAEVAAGLNDLHQLGFVHRWVQCAHTLRRHDVTSLLQPLISLQGRETRECANFGDWAY